MVFARFDSPRRVSGWCCGENTTVLLVETLVARSPNRSSMRNRCSVSNRYSTSSAFLATRMNCMVRLTDYNDEKVDAELTKSADGVFWCMLGLLREPVRTREILDEADFDDFTLTKQKLHATWNRADGGHPRSSWSHGSGRLWKNTYAELCLEWTKRADETPNVFHAGRHRSPALTSLFWCTPLHV